MWHFFNIKMYCTPLKISNLTNRRLATRYSLSSYPGLSTLVTAFNSSTYLQPQNFGYKIREIENVVVSSDENGEFILSVGCEVIQGVLLLLVQNMKK